MSISKELVEKTKLGFEKNGELMTRVFSDESYVKGDKVIIKEHGQKLAELELQNVAFSVKGIFKSLRNELAEIVKNTENNQFDRNMQQKHKDKFMCVCISLLITSLKAKNKYKSNNPEYLEIKKVADDNFKYVKSLHNTTDLLDNMLFLNTVAMESKNILEVTIGPDVSYNADEAFELFRNMVTREEFKSVPGMHAHFVAQYRTDLLKKLEKGGYLEPNNSVYIPQEILNCVKKNLNYEERYMTTNSCVNAYFKGLMGMSQVKKNFDINTFFDTKYLYLNKCNAENEAEYREYGDRLMEILKEVGTFQMCSAGFWDFYVNGIFSKEQLFEAGRRAWFSPHLIIDKFLEINKRALVFQQDISEFEEELILYDEEKTFEFFDTKTLAACITSYRGADSVKTFINKYVAPKYEKDGKDFQKELFHGMNEFLHEYEESADVYAQTICNMYEDGFIDFDTIINNQFSDEEFEMLKKKGLESQDLSAKLYNSNMITQDDVFENYEEDKVFEMINEGMNPNILLGYYSKQSSTQELVNLLKSGKLDSTLDLSALRPDISLSTILKMYQPSEVDGESSVQASNTISYDDLNMLVTAGIITAQEADEIDQAYNYNVEIDKLIDQGLIVGDKNGKKLKRREGVSSGLTREGYGTGVICDRDKQALFQALDDEYIELDLTSSILKNYSLVVMPRVKIAILEPNEDGHGASYVMSIKLALEQIRSSNGEAENVDPLKEYANRTGIRSIAGMKTANHGLNWGYNIARKMKYIHSNMDSLIYSKDNNESEKTAHKAKIEEVQQKIFSNYQEARLKDFAGDSVADEEL